MIVAAVLPTEWLRQRTPSLDRQHDEADRTGRRRIACPLLAIWSAHGALDAWYAEEAFQQTYEALQPFFADQEQSVRCH